MFNVLPPGILFHPVYVCWGVVISSVWEERALYSMSNFVNFTYVFLINECDEPPGLRLIPKSEST